MKLRAAFFGSPDFAVPSLHATHRLCDLVVAVSQPDRPAGRGRQLKAPAVKQAALALGLPVLQPTKVRDGRLASDLAAYDLDVAIVAAYGRILGPDLLALPRFGCVNVHASLLPRWRGAAPIQRAILAGDEATGVSIMQMDAGCDTGPVYRRASTPIGERETAGELFERLAALGAVVLESFLQDFERRGEPVPQPSEGARHAPKLDKSEGNLDFDRPARSVACHIRGMDPWPGAVCQHGERRLRVFGARLGDEDVSTAEAGTVLAVGEPGLNVACARGSIWIGELQPPGRPRMSASAYAHGRGGVVGDRLRTP
ncbi:MAG: methionyl-tRNA formyltransferase [Myxococcales bacterium FL481]|nr:MAG: methionyl-tRNA formyltransferase [Myxococcales bacterium FL481]